MEDAIRELKALAAQLTYTGDDIAFDQALSKLDILIFGMRVACFPRRTSPVKLSSPAPFDWDKVLEDINKECEGEKDTDSKCDCDAEHSSSSTSSWEASSCQNGATPLIS